MRDVYLSSMRMAEFFKNKLASIIISGLVVYIGSFFYSSNISKWSFVLLAMIVLGQGHFITSYFYQYVTFSKKLQRHKAQAIFISSAAVLAIAYIYIYYRTKFAVYGLVFLTSYFLLHLLINDARMCQEYFGIARKKALLWAFFLFFLFAYLFLPLVNTSSFSSLLRLDRLSLSNQPDVVEMPVNYIPGWIFIAFFALAVIFFVFIALDYIGSKHVFLGIAIASALLILPPLIKNWVMHIHFAYFLSFVTIYHFITWVIFYYNKVSWINSKAPFYFTIKGYIAINILANLLVFGTGFLVIGKSGLISSAITHYFFSLKIFMVWTFLHITTTLINEPEIAKELNMI